MPPSKVTTTMTLQINAGAATSNLTPWLDIALCGGFAQRQAQDVHDEIHAKALVLDNGETRIGIVVCDFVCMPRRIADAVKARVAQNCGIAPSNLLICATHTHSGPAIRTALGVNEDPDYVDWVPVKIADAVQLAVNRLQPARIGWGTSTEDRISFNRRWWMRDGTVHMNPGIEDPDAVRATGPIDPALSFLYLEDTTGTPLAILATFALHYVGTDSPTALSADYYGHFTAEVQRLLGPQCLPILQNATSGDINNIDYSGRRTWNESGHAQARKMASVLAGHVLRESQLLELHDTCQLDAVLETVNYTRKTIAAEDLVTARQILQDPAAFTYSTGPFSWVVGQPVSKGNISVYAQACIDLAALPPVLDTRIQSLRIGDAALVALPGEVFAETGLSVRAQSPFRPTLIAELANDYLGYICTQEALERQGGYETWASPHSIAAAGTAENLAAVAGRQLASLWQEGT